MKKLGLTYEEITNTLKENGWCFFPEDLSWRAVDDPVGEPAVSDEAFRDVCEIYPSLTKPMLNLLLAGHGFDVSFTQVGFVTTITLQPRIMLVSKDPEVFARPVKI